jgi:hypothetical protein
LANIAQSIKTGVQKAYFNQAKIARFVSEINCLNQETRL